MKLNEQGMQDVAAWEAAGYELPRFNREEVKKASREKPFWIHFGAEIFSVPFRLMLCKNF